MASSLGEPQLDVDPILQPPAPLQGYVSETVPGPGGEAGEAPQDPANGDGTIQVPAQPSPAGGGTQGYARESVGTISCYEFHTIDLICGNTKATAFFGGYWYGGSIGQFDCPDSGNSGVPGGMGPGIPGQSNCQSTYAGPAGVSCVPTCNDGNGGSGSSDVPTGPVQPPIAPPQAGGGGGDASPNNGPGGSATPNDEPSSGFGTSAGSGPGGSIAGGIFVGAGGGGAGGPELMDYPPNNGTGRRAFSVELSDGQGATAQLDPGDFVRVIRNSDGTIIVGKVTRQGGKTFFIEIQRIQPSGQLKDGTLDLSEQNKVLQAGITQLQAGITQLQGKVTQLTAQITKISEKPLGDGELEREKFYPTPFPPLVGRVVTDDEEPEPPRNDPRPKKKKKNRSQEDSQSKPNSSNPSPSGGSSGSATQLVIVQDDSSQSFVRIT